jgi:FkbM family methyltransferase
VRINIINTSMYFDIGSHIGAWALANVDYCDKIISVEASPFTYQKLLVNCNDNKIINLNYAVCNSREEYVTFYHAHSDTLSTLNKNWLVSESSRFYNEQFTEIKTKAITLDKLIEIYGKPDLIKIDVEGGEYECISSLTQKVDTICFEWASETNDISISCMEYLSSIGFTMFHIQMGDTYTYRPKEDEYIDMLYAKYVLQSTVPKQHWGMVWCK